MLYTAQTDEILGAMVKLFHFVQSSYPNLIQKCHELKKTLFSFIFSGFSLINIDTTEHHNI